MKILIDIPIDLCKRIDEQVDFVNNGIREVRTGEALSVVFKNNLGVEFLRVYPENDLRKCRISRKYVCERIIKEHFSK